MLDCALAAVCLIAPAAIFAADETAIGTTASSTYAMALSPHSAARVWASTPHAMHHTHDETPAEHRHEFRAYARIDRDMDVDAELQLVPEFLASEGPDPIVPAADATMGVTAYLKPVSANDLQIDFGVNVGVIDQTWPYQIALNLKRTF